jgi:hypothetical protein
MGNPTLAQIKKICDILDLELIFQAKVTYPTNSVTSGIRIPQSAFKGTRETRQSAGSDDHAEPE